MRDRSRLNDPSGVKHRRAGRYDSDQRKIERRRHAILVRRFFGASRWRSHRHVIGSALKSESKRTLRKVRLAHESAKRGREQIRNGSGDWTGNGQSSKAKEDGAKCQQMQGLKDQGAWREAPMQSCVYIHVYECMFTCMCIYVYIYTCTYTYVCTHIQV